MKKFLIIGFLFLFSSFAFAYSDTTIDGKSYSEEEIEAFYGISQPGTADTLQARMYYDSTSLQLMLSMNKFPFYPILDRHSADTLYSSGSGASVSDAIYGVGWDGVTTIAPSKNAVYDKIETLAGGHSAVTLDASADTLLSLSTQELGLDMQNANKVYAGPTSGGDGKPTFRALVDNDIPDDITVPSVGGGDPILVNTTAIADASGVDLTEGTGMDIALNAAVSPDTATFTFDATELEALTWGAGGNASNIWTFSLSGATDPVATWGNDLLTLSNGLTLTTGNNFIIGTTQWNSGDSIDGTKVANADLGDFDISSGAWTIEPEVISGKTEVTPVATDFLLLWDATDFTLKKADATNFLGAGGGDAIYVNSVDGSNPATNANFLDNLYIDWALNTVPTIDDITSKFNYAETLVGNPALLTTECIFLANGLLCEGTTADTIEIALVFPDPASTDKTLTLPNETGTILSSATSFVGDVTGTSGATVVADESHAHTTTTISGLVDADMANDALDPDKLVGDATDDDKVESTIVEQNAGTDISTDLEEEVTEGSLADSVIVSADIKDGVIAEADLKIVDSPTDEDFFTYESTTGDFEWHSKTDVGVGYALPAFATVLTTIADSTSYHYGLFSAAPNTTGGIRRLYIPRTGTITKAFVWGGCVVGTNEAVTFAIRLNDTTDTTISSTVDMSASPFTGSNTALSIAVTAGDYIEIKITTPVFGTNPSSGVFNAVVWIE